LRIFLAFGLFIKANTGAHHIQGCDAISRNDHILSPYFAAIMASFHFASPSFHLSTNSCNSLNSNEISITSFSDNHDSIASCLIASAFIFRSFNFSFFHFDTDSVLFHQAFSSQKNDLIAFNIHFHAVQSILSL